MPSRNSYDFKIHSSLSEVSSQAIIVRHFLRKVNIGQKISPRALGTGGLLDYAVSKKLVPILAEVSLCVVAVDSGGLGQLCHSVGTLSHVGAVSTDGVT